MRSLTIVAAVLAASVMPARAQSVAPQVIVEGGPLAGTETAGIQVFKGIPFAAPPVGDLRWRAPQPAGGWQGVRDAAFYGHDCLQNYSEYQPPGSQPDEDCLYLNVWRPAPWTIGAPAGTEDAKLPVMVWIYGGGFVNGSSSRPIYVGARLAQQGIVVVSFNYRLGRFGTFAHPALTRADEDDGRLANYGFMDQIAALQWVRRNIAAFGGDPANVTVVGESAGGMSVHNLVTSPLSQGLFARAVIASGGDGTSIGRASMAEAEEQGTGFARANGITGATPAALAELRTLPAETVLGDVRLSMVMNPGPRSFTSPFPDGRVSVNIANAYRSGRFGRVPVMIGATSGDLGGPTGLMVAGARSLADTLAVQGVPTWYYRFSYKAAAAPADGGAIHADDLPYFFDTVDVKYGARTQPADQAMGRTIASYLVNFVKSGNPNAVGLPEWPAYAGPDGVMMDFAETGTPMAQPDPWRDEAPSKMGPTAAPTSAD